MGSKTTATKTKGRFDDATDKVVKQTTSQTSVIRWLRKRAEPAIVPIAVVVLWWLYARSGLNASGLVPGPFDVFGALWEWVFGEPRRGSYSGTWLGAAWASSKRVLAGYAVGGILGIVLGGLFGYFRPLGDMFEPFIHMLRAIPIIGWLPLAFVFFGFGLASAIFLIAMGVFFPVLVNTMAGIRGVDRPLIRVGRMMGCSSGQILRHVVVPGAMPSIVTGLRVGMGFAWILVIVAEWVAVRTGLGHVLLDAYNFLRYDYVVAAMISVGFAGYVYDRLVALASKPILRWKTDTSMEA